MELFQSELRYFCALKLTQPYFMKQLEGKTEYAKAKTVACADSTEFFWLCAYAR